MKGRVLIVAGSDSGGGAGIQADIKAVTALGGFAMTAITALTAQNTQGVHGVFAVDTDFVAQQMRVVLDDLGADAIKTGMLHSVEVIETVARKLTDHAPDVPLVADPVMVAKGGARLLDTGAHDALAALILPRATVLTPNAPEAEALTGIAVADEVGQQRAGERLLKMGASAVLVKGGHVPGGEVVDLLVTPDGTVRFADARIDSTHTRHRLYAGIVDCRRNSPGHGARRCRGTVPALCARGDPVGPRLRPWPWPARSWCDGGSGTSRILIP